MRMAHGRYRHAIEQKSSLNPDLPGPYASYSIWTGELPEVDPASGATWNIGDGLKGIMNTAITSGVCMAKRNNKGRYATFRCFDQSGVPRLFRRLPWESQDMRSAILR
jgi:hypothetical protein